MCSYLLSDKRFFVLYYTRCINDNYYFILLFVFLNTEGTSSGLGKNDIQVIKELFQTQLAPVKKALDYVLLDALDPWEKVHTEKDSIVNSTNESNLPLVSSFYGTHQNHYCMVLGNVRNVHVICAHIWPNLTAGDGLEALGLSSNDVSNPRNFLRLEKSIEKAFDRKYLTLTPQFSVSEEGTFKLLLTVLNPDLLNSKLIDNSGNVITEFAAINNSQSDYTFDQHKRPFLRLLARHKLAALRKARQLGWIDDHELSTARASAIQSARISLNDDKGSVIMEAFFADS